MPIGKQMVNIAPLALLSADYSRLKARPMHTTTAHNDIAATCFASEADNPIPLELLETSEIENYRSSLTETELAWLDRQGFAAKSGQFAWLESDVAARVVCGWDGNDNPVSYTHLTLPTKA